MVNGERSGLKGLYEPSFARWVFAAAVDWAVIAAAFWAVGRVVAGPWTVVAWVVASWVIGTRQHAIAILGHEGAHGLVSRNRLLNDWATRFVCFAPLGVDLKGYWEFHRAHHLRNGGPDDPETLFKQLEGKWELPMSRGRLARYVVTDLLGAGAPFAIGLAVNLRPRDAAGLLALAAWWGGAIGVVAWTGCWWVLALWFVSFVTSFWCVFRLRMLTEHVGTPTTHCLRASWWQRAVFLPHGTWLHDVHHANQNVPFHQLGSALAHYPALTERKSLETLLVELSEGEPAFAVGEPLGSRPAR